MKMPAARAAWSTDWPGRKGTSVSSIRKEEVMLLVKDEMVTD
jgi:hypothetical protein